MTRIVAGTARGRRLAVPSTGTRPTSDRVREAMFSALDSALRASDRSWSDTVVLDLFAGSGALGLEAASRGARRVLLVERERSAARVIDANVAAVGCSDVDVLLRDVGRLAAAPPPAPAGVVFADPPYAWSAAKLAAVLGDLYATGWIADEAIVVAERPTHDEVAPFPASWPVTGRRVYGDTALWYGRPRLDVTGDPDERT